MKFDLISFWILGGLVILCTAKNTWDSEYEEEDEYNVNNGECKPTLTTVTGPLAPNRTLCHKELIFFEDFSTLNLSVWEHVHDIFGDNVSILQSQLFIHNVYEEH